MSDHIALQDAIARGRVLRSGAVPSPVLHPVEVLCWDDFLPGPVRDDLYAYVSDRGRPAYAESRVVKDATGAGMANPDYRRSLAALDDAHARAVLLPRLAGPRQVTLLRAGYGAVPLGKTEVQVTASGDDDLFGTHTDDGIAGGANFLRLATFVYYLHRRPRPFGGGALRAYDSCERDGVWGPADSWIDVEPADNRLVMFLSDRYHEVLRVDSASTAFADRRFTINGWFSSERDLGELAASGALG